MSFLYRKKKILSVGISVLVDLFLFPVISLYFCDVAVGWYLAVMFLFQHICGLEEKIG